MRKHWFRFFFLVGAGASAAHGCAEDPAAQNTCADCGDASAAEGGASEIGPDAAVADVEPETRPCTATPGEDLPDDEFADSNCDGIDGDKTKAIFVATTGADGAVGTMDAPLRTLVEAIDRATKDAKAVYVCNGAYPENVSISAPVAIYGGFDCKSGWKRTLERATVNPSSGLPLRIKAVTGTVLVDRLKLKAADATEPSTSSIAAFVSDSATVTFKNDVFESGLGAEGTTPATPSTLSAATKGTDGVSMPTATCARVSTTRPSACATSGAGGAYPSVYPPCEGFPGGGGAGGIWGPSSLTPAQSGKSAAPSGLGGIGTSVEGNPGANGTAGVAGTPAAAGFGALTVDGYVASNVGTAGGRGGSGYGGGGGGGGAAGPSPATVPDYFWNGGGGGEGGFGGCGGDGGGIGGAGGASIGLLLWKSPATISKSTVTTAGGGKGGSAGPGGAGQPGGAAGKGGTGTDPTKTTATGYPGGDGGRGGKGGPGGAGAGGPSIGIVSKTGAPTTSAVVFNIGPAGVGGTGLLAGGNGAPGDYENTKQID